MVIEIPIIISSDPVNGAINKTADGSSFSINLEQSLRIPFEAKNITVRVEQSTIWWTIPNIITNQNDSLSVTLSGAHPNAPATYNVIIPQGLYDLTTLRNSILNRLTSLGAPANLIDLLPDTATQKTIIQLNGIGVSVDLTVGNSMNGILGFNSRVIPPSTQVLEYHTGDNQAAFNQIDSFLIHTDLVDAGIPINSHYYQTISQVLIGVHPGSQIVSTDFNPPRSRANNLQGTIRNTFRFWLTDQKNRAVNTNGENWSARIVISYEL